MEYMGRNCPSCCSACVTTGSSIPPQPTEYDSGAYQLSKLLPAGTISVALPPGDAMQCYHIHVEDGWHIFSIHSILQYLSGSEDDIFLRQIDFLIKHRFVAATCRANQAKTELYIRIYLIPFDLPNVYGRLRMRDEATVLSPARRYLRTLLLRVTQSTQNWQAEDHESGTPQQLLISQHIDNRTMADIYSDLPSPQVENVLKDCPPSMQSCALPLVQGEPVYGLRSQLYYYQRRSVIAMLQKELSPENIPNPLFTSLTAMDGQIFYFQPARMEILKECPMVSQPCGGVLCEELGTGKTVMVLALVLATLRELTQPEESILDPRTILTPLSYRTFPFSQEQSARRLARYPRLTDDSLSTENSKIPSLTELLLHYVSIHPDKVHLQENEEVLEDIRLSQPLSLNTPFYHHFNVDPVEDTRSRRATPNLGPRVMYLTSATLIVVPGNLLRQWDGEIQKHCEPCLRVLVMRPETEFPRARDLATKYDIILMSHARFSAEASRDDVSKLHTWYPCRCPLYPDTWIPDCSCDIRKDVSPLLQVRWKRLVVDEGHVSGTISTNLAQFAKILSVERRWIVTGTPTTNLLGLSFGHGSEMQVEEQHTDAADDMPMDMGVEEPVDDSEEGHIRRWTRHDREDLRKLSIMMIHFLGVQHFSAEPRLFDTHVTAPLLDPDGPRPGAIKVLERVMQMVMIRHRIEDVEKDVILPRLKHETVLLDLDPYALKSYNAMQATIVVNAIDSQRVDQDYLFHPSNAPHLAVLVENISQIMFWHIDEKLFNVDELSRSFERTLQRAIERNALLDDIDLLRQAIHHIRLAAEDHVWRATHTHTDVPYRVKSLMPSVYRAWSRFAAPSDDSVHPTLLSNPMLHSDRLVKLRNFVLARPFVQELRLIEYGDLVQEEDHHGRLLYLDLIRKRKKGKGKRDDEMFKTIESAKKIECAEKVEEIRKEYTLARERLKALAERETEATDSTRHQSTTPYTPEENSDPVRAKMLKSSPLVDVRVGPSASSKLNYILNEVLQYAPTEKFLIFSRSPLTLAHISEGLELIQVKCLQFTSKVLPKVREQLVMTFETSETYRVFLMELKHGARGLNLVTASRVIFCEPVWQADVESQAIKRAHRIGQTRPIVVKTLAIRSTSEEAMVARREALKGRMAKIPNVLEESGMRHFIAHPKFLTEIAGRPADFEIPLIDVPSSSSLPASGARMEQKFATAPHIRLGLPTPDTSPRKDKESEEGPPRKKARVVRFAD